MKYDVNLIGQTTKQNAITIGMKVDKIAMIDSEQDFWVPVCGSVHGLFLEPL